MPLIVGAPITHCSTVVVPVARHRMAQMNNSVASALQQNQIKQSDKYCCLTRYNIIKWDNISSLNPTCHSLIQTGSADLGQRTSI